MWNNRWVQRHQISGGSMALEAYRKGKFLIINGKINRFAKVVTSLLPKKISLKMSKSIIRKGMNNSQW